MSERKFGLETLCLHAGQRPDQTGARAVPIHQNVAYVFDDVEHAASLFNLQTFGNIYTRIMNPTSGVFEERMATLEGGRGALATASGMAAQSTALLTLLGAGDEMVASNTLYGGTVAQFNVTFRKLSIDTFFVDPTDPANFAHALTAKTKLLYAETIGNPLNNILDIAAVAAIAHEAGIPLVVDNTMATPCLCRPMEHGADIVVHSATKFIGGHGTSIGGVIIDSGAFPWDNGNFPAMTEPSAGYHGLRFYETFGDMAYIMKTRCENLRTMGACLSPFNSFLFLQGLETLPLRMERHCRNAEAVAGFLKQHHAVSWVKYAGADDSQRELAEKYLPAGAGAVLTFGIKGGFDAGVKFIESAQFLSHLANIGDAKTLIIHPASTTHRQLSDEERAAAGVTNDMVRMSVGLETLDDILWDTGRALEESQR